MKSAIALNPEIKFSSFLKKIPKNVNNPIDKIIQEKIIKMLTTTLIRINKTAKSY